jgi:glutamate---cysteine ligase / carboxylate-amine ligase
MSLTFKSSPKPTLGVEVEIPLIDGASMALASEAVSIIEAAAAVPDLRLVAELNQSMVEINTEICTDVKEVRLSLERQTQQLREIAEPRGLELAIFGNHPFQHWRELKIYPKARYFQILEKFQWLARRMTTFGLHVHVGVADGERAIAVINGLINYIPHLLALSASSPFWGGKDTGLASCRVAVFESFPTGGLPYFFVNWKEFQACYEMLLSTGAIRSIKDIYWDIRPHFDFGTVEVRICDGIPTLRETLALVALVQCLVVWLDDQYQKGKRSRQIHMQRYWLAPENKWQAARYGLEGQIVPPEVQERRPLREEIARLLETLKPVAESLNCAEELSAVNEILKGGSSAARQRAIYYETHSFDAVVRSLIQELKENRPILAEEITRPLKNLSGS